MNAASDGVPQVFLEINGKEWDGILVHLASSATAAASAITGKITNSTFYKRGKK
jgi:hypothetical protein